MWTVYGREYSFCINFSDKSGDFKKSGYVLLLCHPHRSLCSEPRAAQMLVMLIT